MKRFGFTLIELLVVIAIIAILAAILFPVFARVREKARQSACQSNEKQIALALMQYASDFDEYFPNGMQTNFNYYGVGWMGQVYPYIKNKETLHCPNDFGRPNSPVLTGNIYPSYRYNAGIIRADANVNNFGTMKTIAAYNAPASTVLVYEFTSVQVDPSVVGETTSSIGNGSDVTATGLGVPAGTQMYPQTGWQFGLPNAKRHSDGGNYICADGHSKWMKPTNVSFGWRANCLGDAGCTDATASKEHLYGGTATYFAEGTNYAGADRHQLTFSLL